MRARPDMHINVILTSLLNSQTLLEEHELKTYIFRKDSFTVFVIFFVNSSRVS